MDRFAHRPIDRRGFIEGAGKLAVGGLTAGGILQVFGARALEAQQIAKDDKRLHAEYVQYQAPKGYGTVKGYLARPAEPASGGKWPTVLVAHDIQGLNPYIEDVVRRTAVEGFIAFAPDSLTSVGGYPGDGKKAEELHAKLEPPKIFGDYMAAVSYLTNLPESNGKLGGLGFGFGADLVNTLVAYVPSMLVGVSFYGEPIPDTQIGNVKAVMLMHYAANDSQAINGTSAAMEALMQAAGVRYASYKYVGTEHGFHDDTSAVYNKEAATLAWERTTGFLGRYLREG